MSGIHQLKLVANGEPAEDRLIDRFLARLAHEIAGISEAANEQDHAAAANNVTI